MAEEKGGILNFRVFLSLIILIPATMLLVTYLDEISIACGSVRSTVMLAVVTGCMVLLSLMALLKEMLVMD